MKITWERNIWCFGKKLCRIEVEKDTHQKEIHLKIEVRAGQNFEIRTSSSGSDYAQFTLKKIGLS